MTTTSTPSSRTAQTSRLAKFTGRRVYGAAVGDIDGDTQLEVVAVACDTVYAWNANGSVCAGWPIYLPASWALC
jgi:hypothetical protein